MNYRILLSLATVSTLVGSFLTMILLASRASAATSVAPPQVACDLPSTSSSHQLNQGTLIASAVQMSGDTELDFTAAESDAAVTLFGCDCLSCINALRQLRSQPSLSNAKGHCWSSLQQPGSSQKIQEVLRNLDAQETN
jgi:hypothetical protein